MAEYSPWNRIPHSSDCCADRPGLTLIMRGGGAPGRSRGWSGCKPISHRPAQPFDQSPRRLRNHPDRGYQKRRAGPNDDPGLAGHLFALTDVIKIDVEGAEMTVLAGASRLLRTHPTIICEVAGSNAVALQELLTSYGYTLYDGEEPHRGGSRRLQFRRIPWRSSTILHALISTR